MIVGQFMIHRGGLRQNVRSLVRASGFIFVCTFFVSAIALLFAQGRIFGTFVDANIADGCFYWSMPGVVLEIAIRGYNASGTVLSDLFIMAVNATLYAIPLILLLILLLRWRASLRA